MSRRWTRPIGIGAVLLVGLALVTASVAIPVVLLLRVDEQTLSRWSLVGQAMEPVGIFFSGVAFIGIALTLFLQHTDLIKMALNDRDLLQVWPPLAPGVAESKKDHYCNLILNLQKVAYEAHTIELTELRGALRYLMASGDVYRFWTKARAARGTITSGDDAEDFFTAEVDRAFAETPPPPRSRLSALMNAVGEWLGDRSARHSR